MRVKPLLPALVLALACAPGVPVRVEVNRGAPVTALAFDLVPTGAGHANEVEMLRVTAGRESPTGGGSGRFSKTYHHWILARQRHAAGLSLPATVRYGETPPGYIAGQEPRGLSPGTYTVTVTMGQVESLAHFEVTSTGMIK
jgi:hypothetical protein